MNSSGRYCSDSLKSVEASFLILLHLSLFPFLDFSIIWLVLAEYSVSLAAVLSSLPHS